MHKNTWHSVLAALLLTLALAGAVVAQGLGPAIDWWVIAGGGGPAAGGSVTLDGTLGQPIAGPSADGDVTLNAGYWQEDLRAASTTALTSSANPSLAGGPLALTATVSGEHGTPTGTVAFKEGVTTLGTAALAGGQATYDASALSAGTHSLTAVYGGDATYCSSTSATLVQVVQLRGTTTSIDAPAVTYHGDATVTVTVSSTEGAPTGQVSLSVDGGAPLTAALDTAGTATFTLPGLAVGDHDLEAGYAAQGNYGASSATGTLRVHQAATAVTLSSSCNPAASGDTVTFTAQVTAQAPGSGTPAGDVTFREGVTELGTAALDGSGTAAWSTTTLTAGTHEIVAVYAGHASYLGSSSAALEQTIGFRATTTAIDAGSTTVVVTVSSPPAVPTGEVTLTVDGGAPLTAALAPAAISTPPTARATFDLSGLGAGDHALAASYARQGLFEASSASATLHVNAAPQVSADPASFNTAEDTPRAGLRFTVADDDAGGAGSLRFDLVAGHGRLALATTDGLAGLSGANGTGSMAYAGTLAAINAALGGVTYTPDADYSGGDTIALTVDDGGASGAGGAKAGSATIAVTVDAANDAPTLTVPGAQAALEDTALTFSAATGNRIHVRDVDAGGDAVQVTLAVGHGTLTLAATGGLGFTAGDGTGDAAMTFTGSLAAINAALDGLSYTPETGYTGGDKLQATVDDQGHNGSGGALSDSATVDITVSAAGGPNHPPVNTVPGTQTTAEDTPLIFAASGGNLVAAGDADGDPLQVTLAVDHGALALATTGGLTSVAGDGTGSVTCAGSLAAINAALDGLRYTPTENYFGGDRLQIDSSDSAASDSDTVAITVSPVNDAPAVAGLTDVTFTEDGGAVAMAAGVTIDDVDSTTLARASVRLDGRPDGAAEALTVDTTGTSIIATASAGALGWQLEGPATPAAFQLVLRTLRYNNTSQDPDTAPRTLTVSVDDGAAPANATCTLTVVAVNDAPTLTTVADLTGAVEDVPFTIDHYALANAADETDVDDATIGFRIEAVSSGTLAKGGAPAGAGTTPDPGEALVWTPPADANGTLAAFTVVAWDGSDPSGGVPLQVRVVVDPANDAPVLAPASPTLTDITEEQTGGAGTLVSAIVGSTISDVDSGAVEGIAIYAMTGTAGAWQYSTDGGATWHDLLSVSVEQARLLVPGDRLRFAPDGKNGCTASLSYYAWDQTSGTAGATADATTRGGTSAFSTAGDTVSITVTAVNDAPTVSDVSLPGTEDTVLAFSAADFEASFADVDTGDTLQMVRIVSLPAHGTLKLDGSAVAASDEIAPAGLSKLTFTPDPNWNGTTSFDWNGSDGTAYAASSATVEISIAAVDDPPTLTTIDDLTGGVEDTPFTIGYAALAAAADEADVDSATLWFRVEAVSSGTLTKDGATVAPGMTLLGAGESLLWAPPANANGTLQACTVVVCDGTSASAPPVAVRVVVAAANDAPAVSLPPSGTIDEGDTFTASGSFDDPDAGDTWSATVDYGDGSAVQALALAGDKTFSLSHRYAQSGSYSVTVEVSDGHEKGSATLALTVRNLAPTLSGQFDQAAREGTLTAFSLGSLADNSGVDGPWSLSVDWGDGLRSTFSVAATGALTANHLYDDNGSYTVTVQASDRHGASDSQSFNAIVRNVAPKVRIDPRVTPGVAGTQVGLWAQASDPSRADTRAGFDYQWSLRRDGVEIGTGSASSLGFDIPAGDTALYLAQVSVRDKDGGTGSTSWHTRGLVQAGGLGAVDARIQVLWPHGGAAVRDASLANLSAWLLEPGTLRPAQLAGDPAVYLWRALNNEPGEVVATGVRRGSSMLYDFNNVDVSAARDARNKLYFYISVEGVPTQSNVWAHAQDARTRFPAQDVPTGTGPVGGVVDARIEILWPHGNARVTAARQANLTAMLCQPGTLTSVPAEWGSTVRLYRALDNGVAEQVAIGVKRLVTQNGITYPVWDFDNIDVSAAQGPAHKLLFSLAVDGVETHTNVWLHGVDGRTIFPVWDVVE